MGKKNKAAKGGAEAVAQEPAAEQEIPISSAPLPLLQLDARALGEFLELCFADRLLLQPTVLGGDDQALVDLGEQHGRQRPFRR